MVWWGANGDAGQGPLEPAQAKRWPLGFGALPGRSDLLARAAAGR